MTIADCGVVSGEVRHLYCRRPVVLACSTNSSTSRRLDPRPRRIPGLQLGEERRVLLVNNLVAGKMFAA